MADEKLLDLASCNMVTSHPSTLGFPEHFVTERSSLMVGLLLKRLEQKDEGLVSMGYVDLLAAMIRDNPQAFSTQQRAAARTQCMRHFQEVNLCESF